MMLHFGFIKMPTLDLLLINHISMNKQVLLLPEGK